MIGGKVDTLRTSALIKEMDKMMERMRREIAEEAFRLHQRAIDMRITPSGAPQKENSQTWIRRKGHAHQLIWHRRLRNSRPVLAVRKHAVYLYPPRGRADAVQRLHALGYATIWSEIPRGLPEKARDVVRHVGRSLRIGQYVRRGR